MRILKIEQCPSLSGNSRLTYHIGCSDQGDIYFRIQDNTASGYYSKEWVSLVHLESMLSAEKITSGSLKPLFEGKSINSSGFLFAVLIHEGLIKITEGKRRSYSRCDPTAFMTAIQKLMASAVSMDATQPSTVKTVRQKKEAK